MKCKSCKKELQNKYSKYCSINCQHDFQHKMYVEKWKLGLVDGNRGINTRNLSRHIVKYLYNKYNTKCSLCGWDKQNPFSNLPVLEVDHIDGNSENNSENNLRLLCPNCHSLTENYKNLNSKQGRSWRKAKYLKNMPR